MLTEKLTSLLFCRTLVSPDITNDLVVDLVGISNLSSISHRCMGLTGLLCKLAHESKSHDKDYDTYSESEAWPLTQWQM